MFSRKRNIFVRCVRPCHSSSGYLLVHTVADRVHVLPFGSNSLWSVKHPTKMNRFIDSVTFFCDVTLCSLVHMYKTIRPFTPEGRNIHSH
jgi:hypothetical protein